jgi:hypothetical protein
MDPAVYSVNAAGFGAFTILHTQVAFGSVQTTATIPWGLAGDLPVAADFDGSGAAQAAVFRPSTGAWYIRSSGLAGSVGVAAAGRSEPPIFVTAPLAGDMPVPANYDGNAAGVALDVNGIPVVFDKPGTPTAILSPRVEEAIFRPSTETFYIYNPATKATRTVVMPKLPGQGANDVIIPAPADYTGDGKADAAIFDQTLGTYEYVNSTTGATYVQAFFATGRDIPPNSPYPYRAAANAAAPAFRTAGAFLATPPGTSGSTITLAGGSGSSSAAAAVVVGAAVPTGSTSTGKASTLPTSGTVTKAPPIVVTSSSTGSARPAQDAADSAIDSLGKSYKGLFI